MNLLEILIVHIDAKKDIYSSILANNKNGILMDILVDVANKDISARLKEDQSIVSKNIPENIVTKFYLGAIVGVGVEWIENKNKYSKDQMISYIDELLPNKFGS